MAYVPELAMPLVSANSCLRKAPFRLAGQVFLSSFSLSWKHRVKHCQAKIFFSTRTKTAQEDFFSKLNTELSRAATGWAEGCCQLERIGHPQCHTAPDPPSVSPQSSSPGFLIFLIWYITPDFFAKCTWPCEKGCDMAATMPMVHLQQTTMSH